MAANLPFFNQKAIAIEIRVRVMVTYDFGSLGLSGLLEFTFPMQHQLLSGKSSPSRGIEPRPRR